jgi:MerR family transcriptional regulator, heat shock protein HspR
MTKEFWTVKEVLEFFDVDERFLSDLEEEELICPLCLDERPVKVFPPEEMEKLRLAKVLVDEMGVNLPGVEVILRMRQIMFDMRKQFDDILEDFAAQLHRRVDENQ